jgi:hypothetical protein
MPGEVMSDVSDGAGTAPLDHGGTTKGSKETLVGLKDRFGEKLSRHFECRTEYADRECAGSCCTALELTDRGGRQADLRRQLVLAETEELSGESQSVGFKHWHAHRSPNPIFVP